MTTTMPDEIRKVKEVEVNNKQYVTGDIEINELDNTQLGIEEEAVADSRERQMLYSRAVKKSLPQTRVKNFKETDMQWAEHVIEK
ncbi:hypothetical protein F8M41_017633 [Gigaspora margarita]|uniref:Uncharacterized protein n=1 Tax=Gigaspora margarita TaxID=4874 RepID=A0A8H4EUI0_GIGMA|nr:hypothetical protein F8M41_017633 [Gigaspora margarita]